MATMYKVKNRSAGFASYKIPESNGRRRFAPGEIKTISAEELEKLTYTAGGMALLANFLQIMDAEGIEKVGLNPQPEYHMSEADITKLMLSGSLDEFLDCLDFAPAGVIDLIKKLSVSLPLSDLNKRLALKEKTGFDCDAALRHEMEDKGDEAKANKPAERRVKKVDASAVRRTEPKYTAETQPVKEGTVTLK